MSDSDYNYDTNPTPTPYGYWGGGGDAGATWVENPVPENAAYTPVYSGGGDAGTTTTWTPVSPETNPTLNYGEWTPTTASGQPDNSPEINALYRELLGRDADPTGLSVNRGMSADTIRQAIMESPEYRARMGGGATPVTPVTGPVTPVSPGGVGGASSSGAVPITGGVALNTRLGTNPGLMPVNPYYATTSPVQNQYSWAPRSEANPLQGGQPSWGIQQPTQSFDVNRFIQTMLNPQVQSAVTNLPTPYPGR